MNIDNSLLTLLQHHRQGDCLNEVSEALRTLTTAVKSTGKKGKLILELTVAPLSKGGGSAVSVTDAISLRSPAVEREIGVFYVGDDGMLSRNDTRQRELPFQELDGGKNPTPVAAPIAAVNQ